MKILFVCNANLNRSPTFEKWFKKHKPEYEVRSAGIYYGYPHKLNKELFEWADDVYIMDLEQAIFIDEHFPKYRLKYEIIGISDQYDPDDPNLIRLIEFWVKEYFNIWEDMI